MNTQRAGRPRKDECAARREQLLAVARAHFVAGGFERCTVAAIAGAAHVSSRTIYAHFGGKRGLLLAIIEHEGRVHRQALSEFDEIPPLARLRALAGHVNARASDPALRRLRTIAADVDSAVAAALDTAGPGQLMDKLDALLAQLIASGCLHGDAGALGVMFLNCVLGNALSTVHCDPLQGLERFLIVASAKSMGARPRSPKLTTRRRKLAN